MSSFRLSRRALRDLLEIWDYIAADSPDAADQLIEDLYQAFHRLAEMPRMGHERRDLTTRKVLFWPVSSYLVIYRVGSPFQIVRVLHGRRDIKNLLK